MAEQKEPTPEQEKFLRDFRRSWKEDARRRRKKWGPSVPASGSVSINVFRLKKILGDEIKKSEVREAINGYMYSHGIKSDPEGKGRDLGPQDRNLLELQMLYAEVSGGEWHGPTWDHLDSYEDYPDEREEPGYEYDKRPLAPPAPSVPGGLKSIDRAVEHGVRQSRERGQPKASPEKKAPAGFRDPATGDRSGVEIHAPDQPPASRAAAPTRPVTGLDRLQKLFGRPFEHLVQTAQGRVPVDDPAILHADEIDSLMASSAYRQSLHPQAEKTRATVGQWYEATYPGAAQHDDTGRMTRPPRRARPQSAPSWIRDHGPLSFQGPERDTLIGALIPGSRRKPRKRV